jgi:hypothetical protein
MDELVVSSHMVQKDPLVIYTALFGDYDVLNEPPVRFEGCKFVCFTDQKSLKSEFWDIILVPDPPMPPNIMNRRYKLLPHLFLADYKYSLYIDANIKMLRNPYDYVMKHLKKFDFCVPVHHSFNCLYREAELVISLNKDNHCDVRMQMEYYKYDGFPENFGLGENNIILRVHCQDDVARLMDFWWQQFIRYSKRDQLSLMYSIWKCDFKSVHFISETARGGRFFRWKPHKNSGRPKSKLTIAELAVNFPKLYKLYKIMKFW